MCIILFLSCIYWHPKKIPVVAHPEVYFLKEWQSSIDELWFRSVFSHKKKKNHFFLQEKEKNCLRFSSLVLVRAVGVRSVQCMLMRLLDYVTLLLLLQLLPSKSFGKRRPSLAVVNDSTPTRRHLGFRGKQALIASEAKQSTVCGWAQGTDTSLVNLHLAAPSPML